MPSLAQGYGQGLLSGLEMQERQRRMRQADLLDEYRKEQIADIRWEREKEKKSLLAQIKAEEKEAKRQEMMGDIATVGAGGLVSGEQFMGSILGGEETPPETKQRLTSIMDYVPGLTSGEQFKRTRVEEKVEGAPGVRPWYETYLGGEEMGEAARVAGGLEQGAAGRAGRKENMQETLRRLGSGDPFLQEWGDVQWMISKGYTIDVKNGRWNYTGKIPTASSLMNMANKLEEEAFLLDVEERVVVEDLAEQIRAMAEVQIERRSPDEDERGAPVKLPPALVKELGKFESFEGWYNNLPEDEQTELEAEPETLKAIKNWYAVPR